MPILCEDLSFAFKTRGNTRISNRRPILEFSWVSNPASSKPRQQRELKSTRAQKHAPEAWKKRWEQNCLERAVTKCSNNYISIQHCVSNSRGFSLHSDAANRYRIDTVPSTNMKTSTCQDFGVYKNLGSCSFSRNKASASSVLIWLRDVKNKKGAHAMPNQSS